LEDFRVVSVNLKVPTALIRRDAQGRQKRRSHEWGATRPDPCEVDIRFSAPGFNIRNEYDLEVVILRKLLIVGQKQVAVPDNRRGKLKRVGGSESKVGSDLGGTGADRR
jgi:hypothetical protein